MEDMHNINSFDKVRSKFNIQYRFGNYDDMAVSLKELTIIIYSLAGMDDEISTHAIKLSNELDDFHTEMLAGNIIPLQVLYMTNARINSFIDHVFRPYIIRKYGPMFDEPMFFSINVGEA